jgi:long-chain acyl-CoA synthetase
MPQQQPQPNMPWFSSYPKGVAPSFEFRPRPVFEILDETVAKHADRPGFDFLDRKWTWGEVGDLVDRAAKGLQQIGVGKGVHVGMFLPNCLYFIVFYYAILKAGGTVVNYNPLYADKEVHHQVQDSETDIMITTDLAALYGKVDTLLSNSRLKKMVICPFASMLPFPKNILFPIVKAKDVAKTEKGERHIHFKTLIANDGKPARVAIDPATHIAVLQYTGGTTGVPKGAMLTHANVHANLEQAYNWFYKARPGQDRMLGVLPFFHVFAMTAVMNLSVKGGFEIIAVPRFDLDQTLDIIHKKKPNFFPAVPAIYNGINHHARLKQFDLTSLQYCVSGGAPLPVEVKKTFEANTGCVVVEGYGLTESSPIVCVNPVEGVNKPGSIGLPMQDTLVELIDPDTGAIVTEPGKSGELCVTGPQVMLGYWNKPEDSADVLRNGRLHTGDVATIDAQGYVFIVDRIKDMIITNGYKVYPRHVEEAIYLNPAVEECIVAGLPDTARGEIVKAWVKPKEGANLTPEQLKQFLEDKISKIEMPRQVEIRTEPLPKTMVGKLSRKDILAQEKAKKAA